MLKKYLLNAFFGFIVLGIVTFIFFYFIDWYTLHGKQIAVPNLKGVHIDKAKEMLEENDLRYEIMDSVYNADLKRNAIAEQEPASGFFVKPGRIIYLTVNSMDKPKIKMPKLVDISFNMAKAIIKNNGLELGNVTYKFDEIGHNLVLEQLINGIQVPVGKLIDKKTKIDLVVSTNRDIPGIGKPKVDSTKNDLGGDIPPQIE